MTRDPDPRDADPRDPAPRDPARPVRKGGARARSAARDAVRDAAAARLPEDAALTEQGFDAPAAAPGGASLIACGALAHEILAVIGVNGWTHLRLRCLPAKLHLRPDLIPDAVETTVAEERAAGREPFVVYADCGTGGLLQARCDRLGVEMIPGPHCYSFFDGNEIFAARGDGEMTSFYLTDFLVRQFDAFVWRPMGLDRHPELRDMLFGNYERLIHLAQVDDPELERLGREAAARLGLLHERRLTGYGDLSGFLARAARSASD